jgi:hypothetical protein
MDKLQLMKMFLAMGEVTAQTQEEKVAYKERIVFATEGMIKPEDWDSLNINEKEKRLDLLTKEL